MPSSRVAVACAPVDLALVTGGSSFAAEVAGILVASWADLPGIRDGEVRLDSLEILAFSEVV